MLCYVTAAKGVVLVPVTNFGLRDRRAGTLTAVNSSVGVSRKLQRIRANPQIALAYHTRRYGWTDRPEYVLVQGRASLSAPHPRYPETIREAFDFYGGGYPRGGPISQWWLRAWHLRVGITLAVERIVVWPELSCRDEPAIYGSPLPQDPPASQAQPKNGTGPRLNPRRAAKRAAALPESLLGWVGADGFPVVTPARAAGSEERGIVLHPPPGLVPPGERRAGFTAHRFGNYNVGQLQRIHTGWMQSEDDLVVYAPHTKSGYWMPRSPTAYKLMAGAGTRWGLRASRQAGFVPGREPKKGAGP